MLFLFYFHWFMHTQVKVQRACWTLNSLCYDLFIDKEQLSEITWSHSRGQCDVCLSSQLQVLPLRQERRMPQVQCRILQHVSVTLSLACCSSFFPVALDFLFPKNGWNVFSVSFFSSTSISWWLSSASPASPTVFQLLVHCYEGHTGLIVHLG